MVLKLWRLLSKQGLLKDKRVLRNFEIKMKEFTGEKSNERKML